MHKYKNDFPIFKNNKDLVYLDSAATSQKPQVVIDAVRAFYETYNSNIHRGLYGIAEKATGKVEEVRKKVARFINAKDPSEIVFTHGTTEGINILANVLAQDDSCGDVLLSEMEHHSNIVPWQQAVIKRKSRLLFFQVDKKIGQLTNVLLDGRDDVISNNNFTDDVNEVDAISITHVSNVLGTINPIKNIWKKLEDEVTVLHDTFIVDAAQSVPHMPVDVQGIGCSYMAFSGHKMLAPTGVGVLYGRGGLDDLAPLLYGSQMIESVTKGKSTFQKGTSRFEPGTMPIEAIIGLGAAIDYLTDIGMDRVREHEKRLTEYCLEQLAKIDGITIYGPMDVEKRSGVVGFNLQGIHPHDIAQVLADDNICVRAGHHCAMPLHKRLGVEATVRVSFHIYNDEEDIEKLVRSVKKAYKLLSLQ